MMSFILIGLFTASAAVLFYLGFSYQTGSRKLSVAANAPADDRQYWASMTGKLKKGYFVGAAGALLAALALAIRMPVPAEVGCITLLAAMVFSLALLCRKTGFSPCAETVKLQKRWKTILLIAAFGALILTQMMFRYFLSLE